MQIEKVFLDIFMTSFRKFLSEIAVNADLGGPTVTGKTMRPGRGLGVDVDAQRIIPLVVHQKHLAMFRNLDMHGYPKEATEVLGRLMSQPSDGGMAMVNISNSEAESLRSMMRSFVDESERVMAGNATHGVKDDAFVWISSANAIVGAIRNGMAAASKT